MDLPYVITNDLSFLRTKAGYLSKAKAVKHGARTKAKKKFSEPISGVREMKEADRTTVITTVHSQEGQCDRNGMKSDEYSGKWVAWTLEQEESTPTCSPVDLSSNHRLSSRLEPLTEDNRELVSGHKPRSPPLPDVRKSPGESEPKTQGRKSPMASRVSGERGGVAESPDLWHQPHFEGPGGTSFRALVDPVEEPLDGGRGTSGSVGRSLVSRKKFLSRQPVESEEASDCDAGGRRRTRPDDKRSPDEGVDEDTFDRAQDPRRLWDGEEGEYLDRGVSTASSAAEGPRSKSPEEPEDTRRHVIPQSVKDNPSTRSLTQLKNPPKIGKSSPFFLSELEEYDDEEQQEHQDEDAAVPMFSTKCKSFVRGSIVEASLKQEQALSFASLTALRRDLDSDVHFGERESSTKSPNWLEELEDQRRHVMPQIVKDSPSTRSLAQLKTPSKIRKSSPSFMSEPEEEEEEDQDHQNEDITLSNFPTKRTYFAPGSIMEASLKQDQAGSIPVLTDMTGVYDFDVHLGERESSIKSPNWLTSRITKKLYTLMNKAIPFNPTFEGVLPKDFTKRFTIRAMAVFTSQQNLRSTVMRCPNHIAESDSTNRDFPYRDHVIRADHPHAQYEGCDSERRSVVLPLETQGESKSFMPILLRFMCLGSCVGGINRRPIAVVLTLESEGRVYGRKVIHVRVCACPTRDIRSDEKQIMVKENGRRDVPDDQLLTYRKKRRIIPVASASNPDDSDAFSEDSDRVTLTVEGSALIQMMLQLGESYLRCHPSYARQYPNEELRETARRYLHSADL